MTKIGTLAELNVKPGDVVEYVPTGNHYTVLNVKPGDVVEYVLTGNHYTVLNVKRLTIGSGEVVDYEYNWGYSGNFRIVSRAEDIPKLWRDMTPEEKGALLLAHHEGKVLEYFGTDAKWHKTSSHPKSWMPCAIRIKPEPKVETVNQGYKTNSNGRFVTTSSLDHATHVVSFNLINGEPDFASIKMEKL